MSRGNPFTKGGHPQLLQVSPLVFMVVACVVIVVLAFGVLAVKSWVSVKSGEIAVFVKKTGHDLPSGAIVAIERTVKGETVPAEEFKGIHTSRDLYGKRPG